MMKNRITLAIFFCFCAAYMNAQFTDDMEYSKGEPLGEWWQCAFGGGDCIFLSSAQAHSGVLSAYVPDNGTTDGVLDLGNKVSGVWTLEFYMYVPSNKEAYMNLQGEIPITTGEWIVGNIFFNQDLASPGVGLIDDTALGSVNFNFPHDQWFKLFMAFDISNGISNATWEFLVNDNSVIPPGTAFTNQAGTIPTSLGGVNFFSISTNNMYWMDDFIYEMGVLGVEEETVASFSIYPNPSSEAINIISAQNVESVQLYDIKGELILKETAATVLNISHMAKGIYFLQVSTPTGRSTQKFVKN